MTTIELNGGPAAVGAARHAIDRLADQQQLPRIDDLRLLVSELVTNSVLHGRVGPDDHVELHVDRPDNRVRVEVCDDGDGWIRLSQDELAMFTATTRATVNRVLGDLERRGVLQIARGRTRVTNRDELARIAG